MAVYSNMLEQFIRYTGVGAVGTAAHYITLIVLVHIIGMNAVPASSFGFTVGAIVNYFLNYHYTFKSNKQHHIAAIRFFIVAGGGFILNGLIMHAIANELGIHYLIAQIVATGTVLFFAFSVNRLWTFR